MVDVKLIKKNFIFAGIADPAPPLGTVLGNVGVNTTNFCNQFNIYTKNLPSYFRLKVEIKILVNNNCLFSVQAPSTSYFLNMLKFDKMIKVRVHDRFNEKTISCIGITQLVKLAQFKFEQLSLHQAMRIIQGTLKSMNIMIII